MKMRKIIALLLSLTMIIVLVPTSRTEVKAATPASVVVGERENVLPGSTVTVDISIKDNPGILGAVLQLEYDSNLTLKAIQTGDAFSSLTLTKPGKLVSGCKFVWDGQELLSDDVKDGIIMSLTFDVSEDAKAGTELPISISFEDVVDKDLTAVEIMITNGKIWLQKEKSPITLSFITAEKLLTIYKVGEILNVDDIKVTAIYSDETSKEVKNFETNVETIDMQEVGEKELVVSYEENEIIVTSIILIRVLSADEKIPENGTHEHIYNTEWTIDLQPTCTQAGSKSHHCTNVTCNSKSDITPIPATGMHAYGEWTVIVYATYNREGRQIRTCKVCGMTETNIIPATGYEKDMIFTKGNHTYTVKTINGNSGTVIYEGMVGKKKNVSIPKTVKVDGITFKVVEIATKAFKGNKKLTSVTIPVGVTKIGKEAFSGCKKLKKITIKSTKLKSVGSNAIKNINKKATIKVPKSQLKKYKKLFKSKTGYKKTMKIKK